MARTNTPEASAEVTLDRNTIKAELDERGIEYASSAQTKTLAALLSKAAEADDTADKDNAEFKELAAPAPLDGTETPPEETASVVGGLKAAPSPVEVSSPEIIVSSDSRIVLIANQHTAPICLPRKAAGGLSMPSIVLPPGQVTRIEGAVWNQYKDQKIIQAYMDHNLLAEVRAIGTGNVPIIANTSSDLTPPEHLQSEEERGTFASSASVTRQDSSKEIVIS